MGFAKTEITRNTEFSVNCRYFLLASMSPSLGIEAGIPADKNVMAKRKNGNNPSFMAYVKKMKKQK